jgi:hypothetical protein
MQAKVTELNDYHPVELTFVIMKRFESQGPYNLHLKWHPRPHTICIPPQQIHVRLNLLSTAHRLIPPGGGIPVWERCSLTTAQFSTP